MHNKAHLAITKRGPSEISQNAHFLQNNIPA